MSQSVIPLGSSGSSTNIVPKGITHIAFILDESGSMDSISNEIINGFNESLQSIRKNFRDLPTRVSLVKFNDFVTELFWEADKSHIPTLNNRNYSPDCQTKLYDAVGQTVTKLKAIEKEFETFLLIILSDGVDNDSRNFNKDSIREMMQDVNKKGNWTITYIGAKNVDLEEIRKTFDIKDNNITSFDANSSGTSLASKRISKGIASYSTARSSGETSLESFYSGSTDIKESIPEDEQEFYDD